MREKIIYILTIILSISIGVIGTILVYDSRSGKIREIIEKEIREVTITESDTIKPAIDKIYDAVVMVETYKGNRLVTTGTGFVYKKDDKVGYIITNHHVIEDGNTIKVINNNGQTTDAKVLGSDAYADIAVLSIDKEAVLQVAEIGNSTELELGDTLFTVGTPLGSEYMGTVTKGILSGKNRTVTVSLSQGDFMMEVLQTDAAINPGNSGGPLVNINGQVVGVNSLKLVKDEIEGMGFAIPIELVMTSVQHLEKGEEIKRPLLGVEMLDVTNTYALYLNDIYLDQDFKNGVVVVNVMPNTPAAAKLQKSDVILEINGTKINDIGHFRFILYKYSVGDTIKIKYYRDGKIQEVDVYLNKSIEDA
ncbi:MAG: PDZ domain-containing protein [Mollicutes bacterium]|jgi:serine protease Do|nr:PDZ domain-containing protein [Mollicutes bacterium]